MEIDFLLVAKKVLDRHDKLVINSNFQFKGWERSKIVDLIQAFLEVLHEENYLVKNENMNELELRQKVTDIIRIGFLNDTKVVIIMNEILALFAANQLEKSRSYDELVESIKIIEKINSQDLPPEYAKLINKEFWKLVDKEDK